MGRTLAAALLGIAVAGSPAYAAEVRGRLYDTMNAKVIANARIRLGAGKAHEAVTDAYGHFRLRDVPPGAYLVHIILADGGEIVGRLDVSSKSPVTNASLDLSRIETPNSEDAY